MEVLYQDYSFRPYQLEQSLYRTFLRCFLPSFRSFDRTVTEEKNFLNQPIRNKSRVVIAFVVLIRKQPWPPQAILVSDRPIK
jgi:hypothetical protein